jgi:MoaA/NifB/PqqE/SkfB family radical SAM enzyme|tara:strand:- start:4379 stop:5452 length:1074 start_codon:yes stop_codon:yes gene_type:complete
MVKATEIKALEWTNKYNSFNSYKGLTYYEKYENILAWLDGKDELGPPIEASLDPVNACNNNCYYCNSQRYLRDEPAHLGMWDGYYMDSLLVSLADWGVKGFCWGGGGEATLNPLLAEMICYGITLGMESAIITNGVNIPEHLLTAMGYCRWIGVSLDSADSETYRYVRGTDDCHKVLTNIERLVRNKGKADICIKALVLPETIDTLVFTCEIAKKLGVQDFHVRPVDLERKDYEGARADFDREKLENIFAEMHAMETPGFRVYTVTHKYDNEFHVKHDFTKCLASPLVTQICTDKKMYVCVDHRMEERFEIKEWGSDQHRELLKGIDPITECARCTWGAYNEQVSAIKGDLMCLSFP